MDMVSGKLYKCAEIVKNKINYKPVAALVLGSGLGGFVDCIDIYDELSYSEIEGFPISSVEGHKGRFVFAKVCGVDTVIMQGRVHYYEGYEMSDVVLPIRLMSLLGAKSILLTNAAGGINDTFKAGDFMMINDHISSLVPSPLIGQNISGLGERFLDMSEVYDYSFRQLIKAAACDEHIALKEGVYLQTTGPNYETPKEIQMFKAWGADAVGMSTACEAIAAHHAGMRVGAISCISNMAAGISKTALSHSEVQQTASNAAASFQRLLLRIFKELNNEFLQK